MTSNLWEKDNKIEWLERALKLISFTPKDDSDISYDKEGNVNSHSSTVVPPDDKANAVMNQVNNFDNITNEEEWSITIFDGRKIS